MWPLENIKPYHQNAKQHFVDYIATSIEEFDVDQPIVVDGDGVIIKGHGRLKAAKHIGLSEFPVIVRTDLTPEQVRLARLADNRSAEGGYDADKLTLELNELMASLPEVDFDSLGMTEEWLEKFEMPLDFSEIPGGGADRSRDGVLLEKFIIPPFSIFDTRQGYWFERRRAWEALLDTKSSKAGRDDMLTFAPSAQGEGVYKLRNKMREVMGRDPSWEEIMAEAKKQGIYTSDGTSVFDPVVCEVCYKWFCPDKGVIVDPFAGGSVRGLIADYLSYQYHGVDLRQEQIDENVFQASNLSLSPTWYCGNSLNIDSIIPRNVEPDFIFSCPPYYDLERYSENPEDLSNVSWQDFSVQYSEIISKSVALLKEDRFAVFVVGDVRDKKGFYRNFTNLTIEAFQNAGALLYNYIVLINNAGSLAIRANGIFSPYRKVGKQHQDILVFFKGNPKTIKQNFGEIEVADIAVN